MCTAEAGELQECLCNKAFLHPFSQHALECFLQKAFIHLTTARFVSCNVYLVANTPHFWSGWHKKLLKIISKASFTKDWEHLYDKSGSNVKLKMFSSLTLTYSSPHKSYKILHSRDVYNFFFRIISVHHPSPRRFEQDLRIGSITKLLVQMWSETLESQNSLDWKGH